MKGKKMARKLIVSIMILVAAVALAGTSTYAWFTMNANPYVGSYDVQVTTETEGLLVTLVDMTGENGDTPFGKDLEFKPYILASDIEALLAENYEGSAAGVVAPLTHATALKVDSTTKEVTLDKDAATGIVKLSSLGTEARDAEGTLVDTLGTDATLNGAVRGYTYRIYFRATGKMSIRLSYWNNTTNTNGTLVSGTDRDDVQKGWRLTSGVADYNYKKVLAGGLAENISALIGSNVYANPANAVRMAFASTSIADTGTNGITDGTRTLPTTKIWNPCKDYGYDAVENMTGALENPNRNAALDYFNTTNGTSYKQPSFSVYESAAVGTSAIVTIGDDDVATGDDTGLTEGLFYGYVDITTWIEGWDADAFNAILGEIFSTQLKFEKV